MLPALIPLLVKGAATGMAATGAMNAVTGRDLDEGLGKGALVGAGTAGLGSAIGGLVKGGAEAGTAGADAVASGIEQAGSGGSEALAGAGQLSAQTAPAATGETGIELGSQIQELTGDTPNAMEQGMQFSKDVAKDTAKSMATSFAVDKMTPDPTTYGGLPQMQQMQPPPILGQDRNNKALEILKGHLQ